MRLLKLLFRYPVDPVAKTREGLTPLQYYMKYTPEDEQVPEIEHTLQLREEAKFREIERAKTALSRILYEEINDRMKLITDATTTVPPERIVKSK